MGDAIFSRYNPFKLLIDNESYNKELNLSTKWQWVDDVGTQEISAVYFVSHKNKIHTFSGKNHYRLDGDVWVADISSPVSVTATTQLCSDDDYLYEKEGKKEQSLAEFFANYVLANQALIEKSN